MSRKAAGDWTAPAAAAPAVVLPGREQLSCLMDGELPAAQRAACLTGLCADRAAQDDWALWHAAADALRSSEVAALHSTAFCARMSAALQAEPAILAPRASLGRRILLPGAAVAAAATLVILAAGPLLAPTSADLTARAPKPVESTDALAGGPAPDIIRQPQLEAYLHAHRELAGGVFQPGPGAVMRASAQVDGSGR